MLYLCADTSGRSICFSAVAKTEAEICLLKSCETFANGKSSEFFFSELDHFLRNIRMPGGGRVDPKDVDCWVALTGPGSFTGIRICIAALTAISLALNKPLKGLSSLDAAALVSGRDNVRVAARLKLNEFAVKHYDFVGGVYSAVQVEIADIHTTNDWIFINSGQGDRLRYANLTTAIADSRCEEFFQEASALYVRRSEAEINFDKKSVH